jgi:hypothetical protein
MPENVCYPSRGRYTLQWLVIPGVFEGHTVPNNSDAAFKKHSGRPKPSELLLHYNYGAAAVKCWGHGTEVLQNRAKPRPTVPVPAPMGPSKTAHNRSIAIRKREAARAADDGGAGNAAAGPSTGELVESEGQATWDEDDVMLETHRPRNNAISRRSKRTLSVWSNGGKAYLLHLYNGIFRLHWNGLVTT